MDRLTKLEEMVYKMQSKIDEMFKYVDVIDNYGVEELRKEFKYYYDNVCDCNLSDVTDDFHLIMKIYHIYHFIYSNYIIEKESYLKYINRKYDSHAVESFHYNMMKLRFKLHDLYPTSLSYSKWLESAGINSL